MTDEENVIPLPLKAKAKRDNDGPMLSVVEKNWHKDECNHRYRFKGLHREEVTYLIREGETEVECGLCGIRLDPMFVLSRLAHEETSWLCHRAAYIDEMRRLA